MIFSSIVIIIMIIILIVIHFMIINIVIIIIIIIVVVVVVVKYNSSLSRVDFRKIFPIFLIFLLISIGKSNIKFPIVIIYY